MSDSISYQPPLKWGDSFDLLSDARKKELRDRLEAWGMQAVTEEQLGPFAEERLTGLEVSWLAACTLAERDDDPVAATALTKRLPFASVQWLSNLNLSGAILDEAYLSGANLSWADLSFTHLGGAELSRTDLSRANLSYADLSRADLRGADLRGANLRGADLSGANLSRAHLLKADLRGADLSRAQIVETDLSGAALSGCRIYGVSVWNATLNDAIQNNLQITPFGEPEITVDNLEVAQFIYLMLHNDKIRQVIDTIAKKLVLILGRFSDDRKPVLDALRDELRLRNYLPVVFDFEKPANRDLTETVSTLAHMARFVIADLTDARSIPQELSAIIPNLPSVAVQPLIQADDTEYGMFERWRRFPWVLDTYRYEHLDALLATLKEHVIDPAEQRANEIAPCL